MYALMRKLKCCVDRPSHSRSSQANHHFVDVVREPDMWGPVIKLHPQDRECLVARTESPFGKVENLAETGDDRMVIRPIRSPFDDDQLFFDLNLHANSMQCARANADFRLRNCIS